MFTVEHDQILKFAEYNKASVRKKTSEFKKAPEEINIFGKTSNFSRLIDPVSEITLIIYKYRKQKKTFDKKCQKFF